MPDNVVVVLGVEQYQAFIADLPDMLAGAVSDSADYVQALVTADQGGSHPFYPPETFHNEPPAPYYVRYVGEYKADGFLSSFSERMGDLFGNFAEGLNLHLTNSASYAEKVIGETQDVFFAGIGWQKFGTVAENVVDGVVGWYTKFLQDRIDARGGGPT